uniref:Transcription factor IIIC subunit 5 HTH domain-containing protein n=1 Tax=Spongospora subterranea TaxID=70186 RepID=A0A0H5QU82_9EUKA|eukprot:CRZ05573.1 hypothetical protein [Spongospora subterranea]
MPSALLSSTSNAEVELTIGERVFASIEIPGSVNDPDKAIEALNGNDSICKALSLAVSSFNEPISVDPACQQGQGLTLKLRPDDPYSRPIDANISPYSCFLLEIRRPRRSPSSATIQVLGRVNHVARFEFLDDFQIVHNSRFLKDMQLLPPVFMSNISSPRDYKFRDVPTGISRQKRLQSRRDDHHTRFSRFALIPFDSPTIPMGPEEGSFAASPDALNDPVTRLLKEKFDERPLISKRLLLYSMRLANQDRRSVIRFVYCVAYRFSGGPWRGLWCRYGYDPRKDSSSLPYQCIDIRIREEFATAVAAKRRQHLELPKTKADNLIRKRKHFNGLNPSHPDVTMVITPSDIDFSAPPHRSFAMYQLCDLSGPDLLAVVNNARPTSVCHHRTGWAMKEVLDEIRSIMKHRISMWMSLASTEHHSSSEAAPSWEQILHDSAEKLAVDADAVDNIFPDAFDFEDEADFDQDAPFESDDMKSSSSLDEFEIFE